MKLFKAACLAALKEDSLKSVLIARNTAYGYWRGDKVFAYHKRGEVGEIDPRYDTETTFINGGPTDCTKDGVPLRRRDLQGCGRRLPEARRQEDGGCPGRAIGQRGAGPRSPSPRGLYVIHACQIEENSGVSHVTSGRKDPFTQQKCEGYGVSYYKLEL